MCHSCEHSHITAAHRYDITSLEDINQREDEEGLKESLRCARVATGMDGRGFCACVVSAAHWALRTSCRAE
jgi:hypothetical protein